MKLEIIVLAITGLLVANAYYDGKYLKLLLSWKKYYQMIGIAFMGISVYWFMKKNPGESKSLVSHATNFIRYMPIDKDTNSLVNTFANNPFLLSNPEFNFQPNSNVNSQRRMMQSGKSTKRSAISDGLSSCT